MNRFWRLAPYLLSFFLGSAFGVFVVCAFQECAFHEVNQIPLQEHEERP